MIKDMLSFIISNNKYVSDFQQTPIILSAHEYLDISKNNNGDLPQKILFENVEVEILNVSQYLGIGKPTLTPLTKILVGQDKDHFFGFLVDQVIEIINLNNSLSDRINESLSQVLFDEDIHVELSGEKIKFIDFENIIKIMFIN